MKKFKATRFDRLFWPTELALRFPHCYAPHGVWLYDPAPALERPPRPNRRGPRRPLRKKLRFRRAFSEWLNPLPF